jgi:integrase
MRPITNLETERKIRRKGGRDRPAPFDRRSLAVVQAEAGRLARLLQPLAIVRKDEPKPRARVRATGARRAEHTPKTIERASRIRAMRDIEKRSWKQIARALGVAESTAIYLYRCHPEAILEDDLARVERVLYLTAAMSGLRQGALLALRWMDIDWTAQRIRVRRNYVRASSARRRASVRHGQSLWLTR